MELEKIIEELKAKGNDEDSIIVSLQEMVKEGKLTEEDLERAKQLLAGGDTEDEEKKQAAQIFGLEF